MSGVVIFWFNGSVTWAFGWHLIKAKDDAGWLWISSLMCMVDMVKVLSFWQRITYIKVKSSSDDHFLSLEKMYTRLIHPKW